MVLTVSFVLSAATNSFVTVDDGCAKRKRTQGVSLVFQTVGGPPFSCRFAAEHSSVMRTGLSVMRIGLVSCYIDR